MGATNKLKEALAGPAKDKREPAVADGVLSVTPDPPEAAEWRNKSVLDTVAADSTLLEEESGKRPNELFGKFTWRIENFSEIGNLGKRELRSTQFDVGEYKWYILVYPQGCDVCNHLSLFLCVADYDKLLPGWSHFAQFTIAVVNKDPKKSKYSDTLHRFCKKEHDWGWKKFMELSKVLDGFTVADTLVIKAQVQVILDRPSRPFRCLDAQYRRELVRVYLTNVESICRRFCEDRRQRLAWLREEGSSFGAWWRSLGAERRKQLTTEKGESILKGVVKQFFNEKEVTSTLVMDALYCGCRQLECLSRNKGCLLEGSAAPCVVINGKSLTFSFALDALEVVAQLSQDFLPPLPNDKVLPVGADGLGLRSGCDEMSELRRDALERDEKRLAELGRRTVEMYALGHIFTERLERAYRDHQAEKRMKDLIAEEEEAGRLEDERAAARAAADKEKRAKKKEKKKAKKEADKAKRDAEEAERTRQEQEKRAEIERRVLEANERRRQEELDVAAQMQQQHKKQRQQQQDTSTASARKQQPEANGTCSTAEAVSSSSSAPCSTQTDSMRQQQGKQQLALAGRASSDAEGPSASTSGSAAAALGTAGSWRGAAGSKHSSSSSPAAPASLADDGSEVTSVSDLDDSSSMELGSSSKGFTPVVGRHAQHLQHQQAQQAQQQQAPLSARGQAAGRPPQQPPAAAAASQQHSQAPGPSQQQQQQQQPGSIPTGYAAAVAGMRPPPPTEVVSAAAALAEQARRTRQLEEQQAHLESQVSSYEQQVEGLEAAIADRDTRLAEAAAAAARKDQQLAQLEAALSQRDAVVAQKAAALARKDQELQELRDKMAAQQQQVAQQQQQLVAQQQQLSELRALQAKTANELRAAQAVNAAANAAQAGRVSSSSSKDGSTGRKASTGLEDGAAGVGSSGRQRGQSVDLTSSADALASSSSVVAGPSTSAAPWAAIAAGTAAAAAGSSLRDSGTASSSGSQDLAAAAAAAANGPAAVPLHEQRSVAGSSSSSVSGADAGGGAHPGPLSYAEKVGAAAAAAHGASHSQQLSNPGLHSSGASASRAAAGAGSTGPDSGSSNTGGAVGSSGRSSAGERLAGSHERLAGSHERQGSAGSKAQLGPAAAGMSSAADEPGTPTAVRSGIGRTHSPQLTAVRGPGVSSLSLDGGASPGQLNMHGSIGRGSGAPRFTGNAAQQQQQQQQQYGSGVPSSSNRGPDSHRGPERGPRSYLSNGIAGVLHSSVPSSSGSPTSSPSMHSYRNAAAAAGGGAPAGLGPSSLAALGGGGGSGSSMTGMLSSAQGGAGGEASSSLDGGKVPGGLGPQQHPFAYASNMAGSSRAVPGFGPVAATNAKGPADASAAALRSASTSSMAMDDAGLDGFVHMHMIDDLLTE